MIVTVPAMTVTSCCWHWLELVPVDMVRRARRRRHRADRGGRRVGQGVLFVPTYANRRRDRPVDKAQRWLSLAAAADDLRPSPTTPTVPTTSAPAKTVDLVGMAAAAGHPPEYLRLRQHVQGHLRRRRPGFVGSSTANLAWLATRRPSIGPNKIEQARHVRFLEAYPGKLEGLMRDHATLIAPKFAVDEVLGQESSFDRTGRLPGGRAAGPRGSASRRPGPPTPPGDDPTTATSASPTRPPLESLHVDAGAGDVHQAGHRGVARRAV